MVKLLIFLMLADTVIGWFKALKLNNFKSFNARFGAIGKLAQLLVLSCIYFIEKYTINIIDVEIFEISLIYFVVVEFISIIENYSSLSDNIPPTITKIIQKLKDLTKIG